MKKIRKLFTKDLDEETVLLLLELMIYYKASYPVGYHKDCQVQIDPKSNIISTLECEYQVSDDAFLYLCLKSNEMIANMYKVHNYNDYKEYTKKRI